MVYKNSLMPREQALKHIEVAYSWECKNNSVNMLTESSSGGSEILMGKKVNREVARRVNELREPEELSMPTVV